jgi:hypothetical protein
VYGLEDGREDGGMILVRFREEVWFLWAPDGPADHHSREGIVEDGLDLCRMVAAVEREMVMSRMPAAGIRHKGVGFGDGQIRLDGSVSPVN